LRIGPEILKQQAELYRRLRNTLRWILGSLDGFEEAEILPAEALPELERLMLHRVWELNALIERAVQSHDWTGVYPAIHHFCATDLSAFYFDIRKDSLYCDRPDAAKRRACRTVLDILLRCLTAWLAPALPFTAEEAFCARFGADESVHLTSFPTLPAAWRDEALAERWGKIRAQRSEITTAIEALRREKKIGSSLQAVALVAGLAGDAEAWADICITSAAITGEANGAMIAEGEKCARCWKVLPEVNAPKFLCRRCDEAVA
jgi:isoleucyl-tRNA synthetase